MSAEKSARLLDLLTLLLDRGRVVSRDEIFAEVHGYGLALRLAAGDRVPRLSTAQETARRKFERDKDALRRLGIRLETGRIAERRGDENYIGYRVEPGVDRPVGLVRTGRPPAHRASPNCVRLPVTPDEMWEMARALRALEERGAPPLAALRSALRSVTAAAGAPADAAVTPVVLMPAEMLALQVALVADPTTLPLAGRIAEAIEARG